MKSRSLWIFLLALGLLIALVLLQPGTEEEDDSLWRKNFSQITYYAGPRKADSTPAIVLRREGLVEEEFFVESPDRFPVKRRANHTARMVFREWNKPTVKGEYSAKDRRELEAFLPQAAEGELELSEGQQTLRLTFGPKMPSGNLLMENQAESGRYLLLPAFMLDKLRFDPLQLRERRMLHYPSESYTASIRIHLRESGKPDRDYVLSHEREKKEDGGYDDLWQTSRGPIPFNLGNQMDNMVKAIQIDRFNDEATVKAYDLNPLREKATQILKIEVDIARGKKTTLELRKAGLRIEAESYDLLLHPLGDFTDLTAERHIREISRQLGEIDAHYEAQKKAGEKKDPAGPPDKP
ncbi:MAG: hypothetical protein HS115_12750 [Spirochaetales bacterium]|nr:hypothetical protein [Spirochaetales bacterium]